MFREFSSNTIVIKKGIFVLLLRGKYKWISFKEKKNNKRKWIMWDKRKGAEWCSSNSHFIIYGWELYTKGSIILSHIYQLIMLIIFLHFKISRPKLIVNILLHISNRK